MPERSSRSGPGHAEERLTARTRILEAALRRFAVDGLSAPLRRVAADVGVSAGLIIHHFGSREGLLEACDHEALEVTRTSKSALMGGDPGVMLTQLAQAESYAPVVGYVLRRLQTGGPVATQLLDAFVDQAVDYLAQGVDQGTISPSRDPQARARVLIEMGLGALLLQLPAQSDQLDIEELPRWMREYSERILLPVFELYTAPLLVDSSMLDAYLATHAADHPPAASTKGDHHER